MAQAAQVTGSAAFSGPVYFLLHVPKCAGTTIEAHFARNLGDGFLKAPRWKNPLRDVIGNRYRLAPDRLARLRAVSGHSLSVSLKRAFPEGTEIRECVLLREPVGWYLSFYNYRVERHLRRGERHPPPFPRWYRSQRKNPVARFLLTRYFELGYPRILGLSSRAQLAYLNRALARFHFVGDIAQTGALIASVAADLGVPGEVEPANVGSIREATRASIGAEMVARIEAENAVDLVLHRLWGDRGFAPGAPEGCETAEAQLPAGDHLSYAAADLVGTFLKKTQR
ncbi:MAG TPA: hypothetical protein VFR34_02320 [Paracoccaceae bacterium]|nr:hypothetical protein [Paracoccaceae bacterium]